MVPPVRFLLKPGVTLEHFDCCLSFECPYVSVSGDGQVIGHFELREKLGAGAFGTVWKAIDLKLERMVAVKIPRISLDAAEAEAFFREARAVAQLSHPNIVAVLEVGRDGDVVYIVNDYIAGETLAERMAHEDFTQKHAVAVCVKLARALDHAHSAGVIHRDIKPSNILIDEVGETYLMDLGLAKRRVGEATLTTEGKAIGTPAYMSPEQAGGQSHAVDGRTDVYSVGVVLFQMLTRELPFRGNAAMLVHQILNEDPVQPRKLNQALSRDLETICLKCLEKSPEKRYSSAAALADDFDRYLRGEPIAARPVGGAERFWRWMVRNPRIAIPSAAAILLLAAVAVVSLLGYTSTNRALAETKRTLISMSMYSGLAAAEKEDTHTAILWFAHAANLASKAGEDEWAHRVRFRSWSRKLPLAYRATQVDISPMRAGILFDSEGRSLSISGNDAGDDHIDWEFEHQRISRSDAEGGGEKPRRDSMSDSGRKVVAISEIGAYEVLGSSGESMLSFKALTLTPPRLFGNGNELLYAESHAALVWQSLEDQSRRQVIQFNVDAGGARTFAGSPNGAFIAVAGLHEMQIWKTADLTEPAHTIRGFRTEMLDVAFSPDSSMVLSASGGAAKLWSLEDGKMVFEIPMEGYSMGVAFSPMGRFFATSQKNGLIRLWSLPDQLPELGFPSPAGYGFRGVLSPYGNLGALAGIWFERHQKSIQVFQIADAELVGPSISPGGFINAA